MNVTEAVKSRQSIHAFAERPVSKAQVESLLERARYAPSGGNLQPWHVHVVGGRALLGFVELIASKLPQQPKGEGSEYEIYPPGLKEPYRTRRFRCGEMLYAAIGVEREDKLGRLRQFAENYRFFGAPVGLFLTVDRSMQGPQWADLGMFLQTFMLLAREDGLDTCAQEAWAYWHKSVASYLELPPEQMLFCGIALGYRDEGAPINTWRTERASLEDFVAWHGL